uniref:MSP domain-containing protein n=1 Tax=Panagrellus redivivus TaxID=6233 RepID=A0A7E4W9R1_PANRE
MSVTCLTGTEELRFRQGHAHNCLYIKFTNMVDATSIQWTLQIPKHDNPKYNTMTTTFILRNNGHQEQSDASPNS